MAQDRNDLSSEQLYYLPPHGSPLDKEWSTATDAQCIYAQQCEAGHNLIANQIIAGRNQHPPHLSSIKELYQTAARVRRAMATLNPEGGSKYMFYGAPNEVFAVLESIHQGTPRYGKFYDDLAARFLNIVKGDFNIIKKSFGEEYIVHCDEDPNCIHVYLRNGHVPVATVLEYGSPKSIILKHAPPESLGALFTDADAHLLKALDATLPPELFWKEIAAISLDLFHAAPLRQGSQTATLMVLAGIAKAMGYEILPRGVETDHFIEAELTPYQQYIEGYGTSFTGSSLPVRSKLPEAPISVDEAFITAAEHKMRDHYRAIPDPIQRMGRYLKDRLLDPRQPNKLTPVPIEIMALKEEDGRLSCKVKPLRKGLQQQVDHLMDFIGHAEIASILEIPKQFSQEISQPSLLKSIIARTLRREALVKEGNNGRT